MNAEQTIKREFVNRLSFAVTMDDRMDVRNLRYRIDGTREFVDVTYRNGYTKRVNVTGDSCKALAMDVLKAI